MSNPNFPDVIRHIILDYAAEYELLDWINFERLLLENLDRNPNAVDFMFKYKRHTQWGEICMNPNPAVFYYLKNNMPTLLDAEDLANSWCPDAVAYACEHIDEMYYSGYLSKNPLALPWLKDHPEYISWEVILANPSEVAKEMLIKEGIFDKLPRGHDKSDADSKRNVKRDMMYLCENPSSWALDIVRKNYKHIWNPHRLIMNPKARDIIEQCRGLVNSYGDPILDAIDEKIIKQNSSKLEDLKPSEIEWVTLSKDPNAIDFLRKNMDQTSIRMNHFSQNPAIFELQRPKGVFELL